MHFILCLVILLPVAARAWETTFGGEEYDRGFSVIQTNDGNLVIAGETESFGNGNNDIYLIKSSRTGEPIWEKTFGYSNSEVGYAVSECVNGDLIIAGVTSSFGPSYNDMYLLRTTADGELIWEQAIGGENEEVAYDLLESSDGGIIIVGRRGFSESDLCIVKTDENGAVLWEKTWQEGVARAVTETDNGNLVIAGHTGGDSDASSHDVWIIGTDGNGDEEWSMFHPGDGDNRAYDVMEASDGNFIICGYDHEGYGHGREDVFLLKVSNDGQFIWEREFGGDSDDRAYAAVHMTDGSIGICGETYSYGAGASDVYVVQTSDFGALQREITFGGDHFDGGTALIQSEDGDLVAVGTTMSSGAGLIDVYLINIEPQHGTRSPTPDMSRSTLYHTPNPCSDTVLLSFSLPNAGNVQVSLYDTGGRLVTMIHESFMSQGNHSFLWNMRETHDWIKPGHYVSTLTLDQKILIARGISIVR